MADDDAGHDASKRAQCEADGVEACRHSKSNAATDAHEEP
jgi:hypothetical protein